MPPKKKAKPTPDAVKKSKESEQWAALKTLDAHREHVTKVIGALDNALATMDFPDAKTKFMAKNTKLTCIALMLCSIDKRLSLMVGQEE